MLLCRQFGWVGGWLVGWMCGWAGWLVGLIQNGRKYDWFGVFVRGLNCGTERMIQFANQCRIFMNLVIKIEYIFENLILGSCFWTWASLHFFAFCFAFKTCCPIGNRRRNDRIFPTGCCSLSIRAHECLICISIHDLWFKFFECNLLQSSFANYSLWMLRRYFDCFLIVISIKFDQNWVVFLCFISWIN